MSDPRAVNGSVAGGRSPGQEPIIRELEICNKKGLHARASAKFVQMVEKFDADVKVSRGSETVGGNSIMGLMPVTFIEKHTVGDGKAGAITRNLREAYEKKLQEETT